MRNNGVKLDQYDDIVQIAASLRGCFQTATQHFQRRTLSAWQQAMITCTRIMNI